MGRTALDVSRISDGTEDQIKQVALNALQDQATVIRTAGDAPTAPGAPTAPATADKPLTRAQSTLLEAMSGFDSEPDHFKAIEQVGPKFETAIKQADEDFTTRMTEMATDFRANKPAVDKADKEVTAGEAALLQSLQGIQDPTHRQMAAQLALKYLGQKEGRFDVDQVFKPFPDLAAAIKQLDTAKTENAPILAKMAVWEETATTLVMDRFRSRLAYGAALDSTGLSKRAQEMYTEGFGILGQPVPDKLKPRRDPNIREA